MKKYHIRKNSPLDIARKVIVVGAMAFLIGMALKGLYTLASTSHIDASTYRTEHAIIYDTTVSQHGAVVTQVLLDDGNVYEYLGVDEDAQVGNKCVVTLNTCGTDDIADDEITNVDIIK